MMEAHEYEAMSATDLAARFSEYELKQILKQVFGWDSDIYFCPKEDKVAWIAGDATIRQQVEERIAAKRAEHRTRGAEHRGAPKKSAREKVEEQTADRTYRFIRRDRVDAGTTDAITGRKLRIGYVVEDTGDGQHLVLGKGTVDILAELKRIEGYDPTAAKRKVKAAERAGEPTLADVIEAADEADMDALAAVQEDPNPAEPDIPPQTAAEVDALLNSVL